MLQTFSCPNCGAALEYEGTDTTVHCTFCESAIVVPEALRSASNGSDPQIPDPSLAEVAVLFREGKRVQATIRYREITGAGLKEAKGAIDRFAAGEPLRRPNLLGG